MPDPGRAARILVYAPNGELKAAVEVKVVAGRAAWWPTRLLSNLLESGVIPDRVPYFLLVTYDTFYLWGDNRDRPLGDRPDGAASPGAPEPDRRADAARVLAQHLAGFSCPLAELGEEGLEILVSSWLPEATHPAPAGREVAPEYDWLSGSGFLDAVRGCRPVRGQAGW